MVENSSPVSKARESIRWLLEGRIQRDSPLASRTGNLRTPFPCHSNNAQITEPRGRRTPMPNRKILTDRPKEDREANIRPGAQSRRRTECTYPRSSARARLIMTAQSSSIQSLIMGDRYCRQMTEESQPRLLAALRAMVPPVPIADVESVNTNPRSQLKSLH